MLNVELMGYSQTCVTCCSQQCCNKLCWHIVYMLGRAFTSSVFPAHLLNISSGCNLSLLVTHLIIITKMSKINPLVQDQVRVLQPCCCSNYIVIWATQVSGPVNGLVYLPKATWDDFYHVTYKQFLMKHNVAATICLNGKRGHIFTVLKCISNISVFPFTKTYNLLRLQMKQKMLKNFWW